MDVPWVTGRQGPKDEEDFSGRMDGQVAMLCDVGFMISCRERSTYFILPRAISMAFCRLGSPVGSILCLSAMDLSTSCGFPAYVNVEFLLFKTKADHGRA